MLEYPVKERYTFDDLVQINHLLRTPDGCPWDKVQTHQSIRRNFLEEVYEACEAIDNDDPVLMQEELGDVLMQVTFHADIEKERGRFTLDDVCDQACKKLIFRHPNVFGEKTSRTWDDMKALEKGQKTATDTLDSVARSLPALWRADKLVKKARKAGFTAPQDPEQILKALEENPTEEALGDLLFALCQLANERELDPEMALHAACERYIARFTHMEQAAMEIYQTVADLSEVEQLCLWNEA